MLANEVSTGSDSDRVSRGPECDPVAIAPGTDLSGRSDSHNSRTKSVLLEVPMQILRQDLRYAVRMLTKSRCSRS